MLTQLKGYLYLAFILGGLAFLGAIYAKGQYDAKAKAQRVQYEATIKDLNATIDMWVMAAKRDGEQAMRDQKDADLDADAGRELLNDLTDPNRIVYDAPDADRLRDFIEGRKSAPSAPSAK